MVLPVPGGPQKISDAERARVQEPRQRPVRPDEMLLADDLGQLRRAQPVGERPRRRLVEAGGGEEVDISRAKTEVSDLAAARDRHLPGALAAAP